MKRHKCYCKCFHRDKGFGFLEHEAGDVFIHISKLHEFGFEAIESGDIVECSITSRPRGLVAHEIYAVRAPEFLE